MSGTAAESGGSKAERGRGLLLALLLAGLAGMVDAIGYMRLAAAGQALAHLTGRYHLTAVLAAVAVLLTIAALLDTAPLPMVLAMGALNPAMHRAGNVRVNLTFVTGTLVRFGAGLGDFLIGRAKGWDWVEQTTPWLGLVGGAILAGAAHLRIGAAVDWMPVAVALALFLSSLFTPAPQ